MYDSVTPGNIPQDAAMVAGYGSGPYTWPASAWARFPAARRVVIVVSAGVNAGNVLDVEQGDATPAQAPGWCVMRRAAGSVPSVYCNASTWPAVRAACAAAKVPEPPYWVAAYPGAGPVIPAGAIAHQYEDAGPYDLSVVADFWPGVDPAPWEENPMYLVAFSGGGWYLFCPTTKLWLPCTSVDAWTAQGVPQVVVTQAEFEALNAWGTP
jgi:hypothetical protein